VRQNEKTVIVTKSGKIQGSYEGDLYVFKGIPYAAGVIADGHQGQTYCYEVGGCSVGFAVNSGRIAGESAAKFVLGK
jgi:hypothetical protein